MNEETMLKSVHTPPKFESFVTHIIFKGQLVWLVFCLLFPSVYVLWMCKMMRFFFFYEKLSCKTSMETIFFVSSQRKTFRLSVNQYQNPEDILFSVWELRKHLFFHTKNAQIFQCSNTVVTNLTSVFLNIETRIRAAARSLCTCSITISIATGIEGITRRL